MVLSYLGNATVSVGVCGLGMSRVLCIISDIRHRALALLSCSLSHDPAPASQPSGLPWDKVTPSPVSALRELSGLTLGKRWGEMGVPSRQSLLRKCARSRLIELTHPVYNHRGRLAPLGTFFLFFKLGVTKRLGFGAELSIFGCFIFGWVIIH